MSVGPLFRALRKVEGKVSRSSVVENTICCMIDCFELLRNKRSQTAKVAVSQTRCSDKQREQCDTILSNSNDSIRFKTQGWRFNSGTVIPIQQFKTQGQWFNMIQQFKTQGQRFNTIPTILIPIQQQDTRFRLLLPPLMVVLVSKILDLPQRKLIAY